MLLILLLVSTVNSQWLLLEKDTAEVQSTEADAKPSGRTGSSLLCRGDDLFMFGGFDGSDEHSDMWKYETETRRWIWQPDPPKTVKSAKGMSYWYIAGKFWFYGGYSSIHDSSDMWSYEPETRKWSYIIPLNLGPGKRFGSSFWTHKSTNNLYLYGGFKSNNESYGDLWSFNILSKRWTNVNHAGDKPGPRIHSVAVLGHSEDTVYFFGGSFIKDGPSVGKMRQLDLTTMTWSFSPIDNGVGPPSRSQHTMWMTPKQDKVAIFGGRSGSKLLKDLWYYDHNSEHWSKDEKPGNNPTARYGSSFCIDEHGYLFMFGGSFSNQKRTHNDIWKNGPLTSTSIFQLLGLKLDTAASAAVLSATMSTILVVCLFFYTLYACVTKYKDGNYITASVYKANLVDEL